MSQLFQARNVPHFTSPTIPLVSQPLTLERKGAKKNKKNTYTLETTNVKKRPQKKSQLEIQYVIMEESQCDLSYRIARQDVFYNPPKQNAC